MQSRKHFSPPMVGGSSLLVIFAILCLTIFTLLALSTAQADSRLSDASIKAVSDYYAADMEAERILSLLRQGEMPPDVTRQDNVYSYSCPINDNQSLFVTVQITETEYTILQWQMLPTIQWESDDELVVWDGEMIP